MNVFFTNIYEWMKYSCELRLCSLFCILVIGDALIKYQVRF